MALRKVAPERTLDRGSGYDDKVREFIRVKKLITDLKKDETRLRDAILPMVEGMGEEDDKGNVTLQTTDEIDGYRGVRKVRAVSFGQDDEAAAEVLAEAGLLDRCMPPRPALDRDEVYAALFEGLLTEEQVDRIFPEKVQYRVVLVK